MIEPCTHLSITLHVTSEEPESVVTVSGYQAVLNMERRNTDATDAISETQSLRVKMNVKHRAGAFDFSGSAP